MFIKYQTQPSYENYFESNTAIATLIKCDMHWEKTCFNVSIIQMYQGRFGCSMYHFTRSLIIYYYFRLIHTNKNAEAQEA